MSQDYDPQADFSRYRSWSWLPPGPATGDPRIDSDLVASRVRQAIEATLAAKGYSRASTGEGDFGVGWHAAIEGRLDVQTIDHFYGYGRGWGPRGGMTSETLVRQYELGTLIVDLVDTRSRRLVWRGSAQAEVNDRLDPVSPQSYIYEQHRSQ